METRVIKHGQTIDQKPSKEYGIWLSIKQRCTNPKVAGWKDYGARGIIICDEWSKSFEKFLEDMGPRTSMKHAVGRIDLNKGYNKKNCKWILKGTINRKKRGLIMYKNETATEASRRLGGCDKLVNQRMREGLSIHDAFTLPFISSRSHRAKKVWEKRKFLLASK